MGALPSCLKTHLSLVPLCSEALFVLYTKCVRTIESPTRMGHLSYDSGCSLESALSLHLSCERDRQFSSILVRGIERISFELFHEQLPLPVPCYDLLPVTELTVTPQSDASGIPGSLELTGGEYKT